MNSSGSLSVIDFAKDSAFVPLLTEKLLRSSIGYPVMFIVVVLVLTKKYKKIPIKEWGADNCRTADSCRW